MSHDTNDETREQLAEYLRLNPDASAVEAVAVVGANPAEWRDAVADALEAEEPVAAIRSQANQRNNDTDTGMLVSGENTPEEPGSGGATPPQAVETTIRNDEKAGSETVDREAAVNALRGVIEFYYGRVDDEIADHTDAGEHPERPNTAREYFTEVRGWNDDTVDELKLGWAPADHIDQLVAYLHERGHSREAILATGAVGEGESGGLYATFSARYVLPYYDAEGKPAYAIARCTGGDGGGAKGYGGHPGDYQAGKYAKLRHTDDRVPFEEPIYGLDTLAEGDHVVVAEGIADAITARERGYAVLSPVAKEFKQSHYGPLLEAFDEFDVSRVTILPDVERAGYSMTDGVGGGEVEHIRERVTIPATAPGIGGALRTADNLTELADTGHEIYVGKLPLPAKSDGLHKVDLDDYLGFWDGDLGAVLASAKPPTAHPEYEAATSSTTTGVSRGGADGDTTTNDSGTRRSGSGGDSALWELDLGDLVGLGDGDRRENPFSHKGNSETYFVGREQAGGDVIATDYKANGGKATYNALTALLVDAGERHRDDPEGSLSDAEVFAAWKQAKRRGDLADDDPVPYRAVVGIAVDDGLIERDNLVERDSDTGRVVPEDNTDTDTYTALPGGMFDDVVAHIREEYDLNPGREQTTEQPDADDADHRTDPRERVATVDMRRAWEAAARVTPDELEVDLGLAKTDDGEAWLADGDRIGDVVRAVAFDTGRIESPDDELAEYSAAYNRAREEYGAPLPRYYTTADAIAEFDAVLDVIGEVTFWDLNTDALNSEVTAEGDEVSGDAVRALNPAWRESESGESVIVFDNGTVYDADTERRVDALRLVALDSGLIDAPGDALEGEDFTEAYTRARIEYGAPLPNWEPADDGTRQVTPQLPPTDDLVDEFDYDGIDTDELEAAREEVEHLIGDVTTDDGEPTVVTSLPATGKTTGTIKTAKNRPLSYLAPRKELQKQALDKAERWDVDAEVLPVFCDDQVREEILDAAVSHVRSAGKDRLRDRWAVLTTAFAAVGDDTDAPDPEALFVEPEPEDEADEVDLQRPTCETARGDHGVAWALAVHVARTLGYTPREIHQQAEGLFGAPLPCDADEATCEYSDGWDRVTDPDNPSDLLVGSYVHAHVESVRTHYDRGPDGDIERTPRAVVLDEFPGEAFTREFGGEAVDHATWLASSLVDEVEDRRDMRAADLHTDEWVQAWLDGRGEEVLPTTIRTLERFAALFDAQKAADEIRGVVDSKTLRTLGLAEPLEMVIHGDGAEAFAALDTAVDAVNPEQPAAGVARWAGEAVREPLTMATADGTAVPSVDAIDSETLPDEGDLRGLVDRAIEAVTDTQTDAQRAVQAAITALRGGRDGCRRLAAWADDGYAHPDAHHLLTADITPTGETRTSGGGGGTIGRRIHTDSWAFDENATGGTVLDHVETGGKSRVVADRNDHGALLHTPPCRESGGGGEIPLVGLDATGRCELWSNALGEPVRTADVHTTPRERAEFLESALSLRVIQAADRPRPYEGDPTTKDTEGDVALLEALADEYSGIEAPRTREEAIDTVGNPAAITTKGVREVLEPDSRLADVVDEWENYGNITGANDLGEYRLGAILGSQHYGDHAIERFCALAGEEVDTSRDGGRGGALDYGNDLANTYLKHMREDQTMQAILRFARGDSGATVVARTSALREDLPVVGRGQVVETWSDTATTIAQHYRRLGGEFSIADVADAVNVTKRQVRRVLSELAEAGYLRRVDTGAGQATVFNQTTRQPGAGEVSLPERADAVANDAETGHSPLSEYYTWNVRVSGVSEGVIGGDTVAEPSALGAPPSPPADGGVEPPS